MNTNLFDPPADNPNPFSTSNFSNPTLPFGFRSGNNANLFGVNTGTELPLPKLDLPKLGIFAQQAQQQRQAIDNKTVQASLGTNQTSVDPTSNLTTKIVPTTPSITTNAVQEELGHATPSFNFTKPDGIHSNLDGKVIIPTGTSQADINAVAGTQQIGSNGQLFNPFGGVDLHSALFKVGQSFGSEGSTGNTIRGVGAVGKSLLGIGRTVGAGLGFANREKEALQHFREQQRRALANSNFRNEDGGLFYYLKNGGKLSELTPEQALTGEYITGLPTHVEDKANAEVEVDEYIKHPNGDVQRVVGKTHDQGGEKVNLESGTLVVSDNLKIGKDLAKELNKEYDIKTKAKDTYASVITKYTKKIGLTKLNEEQTALFERVKKEEETKDESTQNLNKEFLSGRIKEIEDKKKELEGKRAEFTDLIFNKQEKAKGTDLPELERFKNGGITGTKSFKNLLKKYNLTEEQALSYIEEFQAGGLKKYKDGAKTDGDGDGDGDNEGTVNLNQNKFNTNALSPRQRQRFSNLRGNNLISGNIKSEEELQERMRTLLQQHPVLAKEAFNIQTNADGTLDFDITKESISAFQHGFNDNFNALDSFINGSSNFSEQDKASIHQSIQNEIFVEGDKAHARDFDGIFGNFTSSRLGATINTVTPSDLKKLKDNGIVSFKQLLDSNGEIKTDIGLSDESKQALKNFTGFKGNFLLDEFVPNKPTEEIIQEEVTGQTDVQPLSIQNIRSRLGFPLLPDQSALSPEGLQPHLKINRRLERLDPVKVTTEENLKEINRSENFVAQQLASLPDSQRRAALANLTANSQNNLNKAITQTNIANAQNFQQTEQFNIGQSNQEENFRAVDALDFERRQLTALAKTEEDLFNFFEFNRKVQLGNFNTVNRLNTLNSIYENFNTDGSGINLDTTRRSKFVVPTNSGIIPTTVNINSTKKSGQ